MIGLQLGYKIGLVDAPAVFSPSVDATSGKGVPTAAELAAGGYTIKKDRKSVV